MSEKQRKKRIRLDKIDEWIAILKSTERVDGETERQKQWAITYLENYVDLLKRKGKKTVVLEEKQ